MCKGVRNVTGLDDVILSFTVVMRRGVDQKGDMKCYVSLTPWQHV